LSQIFTQKTADLPQAGQVQNVNFLLGTNNIVGIKTGNSDQAGGVYLSASTTLINGRKLTVLTALMNAPNLWQALNDSLPLIKSAQANFANMPVLAAGSIVGEYNLPWGGHVPAVVTKSLTVTAWRGGQIPATISLRPIKAAAAAGQAVGSINTSDALNSSQSAPVTLQQSPPQPSWWWRLTHL
jgi:D-alanyl-D-alanine carboxypeptidase (penicillin-binding protein 5/6)